MKLKKESKPWFVSLGAALWATDSLVRSHIVRDFQSTFVVFFDHLISLFLTIPLFIKTWREILKFDLKDVASLIFISLGGSALATIFFTKSFALTSNYTIPVLIQKLQPIIAILLAYFILKEHLTKKFWLWSALAIIGAYFVSFSGDFVFGGLATASLTPILYALLAAILWGASTVFGKLLLKKYSFSFVTAVRYIAGTVFLFIIVLMQNQLGDFMKIDFPSLMLFFVMAYIPGFLALFIYYFGLKGTKASVATICELTFPISAVVLNWVFLGSVLSFAQIAGAVLLLFAITKLSYENNKIK
ncbi:DMT family transporter [Candidatus Woesearchaeota archaeon]|nr:DMT family transporter [Candidatus Woesearchaeota archaeon]